jgi:sugar/nucleoside kinase (ribokinase family)
MPAMLDATAFLGSRLCVVGNLNRDLKTAPFPPGPSLFEDGETALGGVSETVGGGGANSAAMAAGLGAQATFIGQIGDDPLGQQLVSALERAGVRCCVHRDAATPTGTTLNLVYDSGRRHFLSCHPNNAALQFDQLDLSGLAHATHLLRADIWFSEAMLHGGNQRLFAAAREAGVASSIDLNWDPLWGRVSAEAIAHRKAAVSAVLPWVDLAHGNVRELCEFTGAGTLRESVDRLLERGVGAVVAHLGAEGAGWFSREVSVVEPAAPVSRRVQATGTGDLLSVCLMLLHQVRDASVGEKLRLANRIVAGFIQGEREFIPRL